MRRAVFLDRDGTLIEEMGYLDRLDRLQFFPYSIDAVRLLNRAGFAVVVTTNQAGIARGLVEESFVAAAHRAIAERLAAGGASIDGFYYCPHHPDGIVPALRQACECRKPRPGMLVRAASELQLDLSRSFAVGDRLHDVEAAETVGGRGILVRTGHGARDAARASSGTVVADNLIAAVSWILHAS
ncbi:MAG TPA: HAD family hydrolase [Vicinamibacterales bacterium]|nr:HAD family hydrolase [Vicinamibacterales bacterium]